MCTHTHTQEQHPEWATELTAHLPRNDVRIFEAWQYFNVEHIISQKKLCCITIIELQTSLQISICITIEKRMLYTFN